MAKSIEKTGHSVEEAVSLALQELNLAREEVEVTVLEEATRGIFGIGSKPARVLVQEIETPARTAANFLKTLTDMLGTNATIQTQEDDETLSIVVEGDDMGILIGRRGETLDALQYLTSLVVNRNSIKRMRVRIDTEDYRKKREETLVHLAAKMAQKVKRTGRRVMLEPMNPYERRVLHIALRDDPYVTSYSEGEEPNRHIVIALRAAHKADS